MIHRCCTLFLIFLASLSGGCSWSMKMPPESKHAVMLTAEQAAATPFDASWRKVELQPPSLAGAQQIEYGDLWFLDPDIRATMATTVIYNGSDNTTSRYEYALGIWDLGNGACLSLLEHVAREPALKVAPPTVIALDESHDLLLSYFDGSIHLWQTSTQSLVRRIDVAAMLDEHGVSRAAYEPLLVEQGDIDPDRATVTARLPVLGVRTWNIATGASAPAQSLPSMYVPSDAIAHQDDMVVTSSFRLKRGSEFAQTLGDMRGPIASRHAARFSPSGRYLVGLFWSGPYMLDFTPDLTPPHLRVWDTQTGEMTTWFKLSDTRQPFHNPAVMFLNELQIAVATDDSWRDPAAFAIIDVLQGREVARNGDESPETFRLSPHNPFIVPRFQVPPEIWIARRRGAN